MMEHAAALKVAPLAEYPTRCSRECDKGYRKSIHGVALAFGASWLLMACGTGGTGSGPVGSVPAPRGTLLQYPPALLSTQTVAGLISELSGSKNQTLLALSGVPLCDIQVFQIRYVTEGGAGEATTASGALMVPSGLDSRCHGSRPLLLYAHGTTTDRTTNIADLSNAQNAEGLLLVAMFAAQGYIVIAPNYAGYDTSTLPYHPYLNADQQSKDLSDALAAARSALPLLLAPLTSDNGQLFITGYSQGGFVAMATQRAMQDAGMKVTASAPMSGPYALAAFVDAVYAGRVSGGAPILMTFLMTAYQRSYSDIYGSAADVFEAPYATGIDDLLPTTLLRSELYSQGKIPQFALFSAVPPDPSFAAMTPATMPVELAPLFAVGFGSGSLIKNSYRLSYLQDEQANPDGGWPIVTTGVRAANPTLPFRLELKRNDLRNWLPAVPTLLCGGDADPSVFWLNTELMQQYWTAQAVPASLFSVLNLEAASSAGDLYPSERAQFAIAKQLVVADAIAQGATDGGQRALIEAYHATLVAPFCLAAVRSFFSNQ